jgi:3-deoxy-manno-octulosonate cytidylyltransferase (CMP-KDO synthetase)
MKVVGVVPARYESTRFPGKPLADICGKPMIWWVYTQAKKVSLLSELHIATDDMRIADICADYGLPTIITRNDHPNHIARVWEASESISADFYICVNGDEPLIEPELIEKIIPPAPVGGVYFGGAMRKLTDPAETIDSANIKLAACDDGRVVYMSRTPVPYPQGTLMFEYKKYVGVECFTKAALDFFVNAPMGRLERIEDIDHLRFIENGHPLYFTDVKSDSISVDTAKDLEKVRGIVRSRAER